MGKVKFGARIMRGFIYGQVLGLPMALVSYAFAIIINKLAGGTVIDPGAMALAGYSVGLTSSIGIEVSKEMEEG